MIPRWDDTQPVQGLGVEASSRGVEITPQRAQQASAGNNVEQPEMSDIPEESASAAPQQSAMPTWDDTVEVDEPSTVESFTGGVRDMVSFGFDDELEALGLTMDPLDYSMGHPVVKWASDFYNAYKDKDFSQMKELYKERLQQARNEKKREREANPAAYTAGQVAGGLATAAVPGGAAVQGARGAGMLARAGQAAKVGAGYGAAQAAGSSEASLIDGEVGEFAEDVAEGAAIGAAGGALTGPAAAAGRGIKRGAEAVGRRYSRAVDAAEDILIPERARRVFDAAKGMNDDILDKPAKEVVETLSERVKQMTPREMVETGAAFTPFLIEPVSTTLAVGTGLAARKLKPLAVNKAKKYIDRYAPKKLTQMGRRIDSLMRKPGSKIAEYLPAYERAVATMGIGGAGVIHAHLLETDPEYRKLVKEEIRSNETLLFNQKD